ncbi:MAG: hypothetical protein KC609_16905 [Myxococcales bacterium]|nr:hypothetical protein [Myxococcales bacterium]
MKRLAAALVLVWLAGCSGQSEREPLEFKVLFAQPPCGSPRGDTSTTTVTSVSVKVFAPSTDPDKEGVLEEIFSTSKSVSNSVVNIDRVPIADKTAVVVTGDSGGTTWYGKKANVDIKKGRTTAIDLRLTRVGRLSCVTPPTDFTGRIFAGVAVMSDGRVFIGGGFDQTAGGDFVASKSAYIYNPATGEITRVKDMIEARGMHGAIGLNDGRVLLVGGVSRAKFTANAGFPWSTTSANRHQNLEIYDPKTDQYSERSFNNVDSFVLPAIAKMLDGSILVAGGGLSPQTATQNALTFNPDLGGDIQQEGKLLDNFWFGASLIPYGKNSTGLTRVLLVGANTTGIYARVYQAQSDKNFGLLETVAVTNGTLRAFSGVVGLTGKRFVIAGGFPMNGNNLAAPVDTVDVLTVTDNDDFLNLTGTLTAGGKLKDPAGFVLGHAPQGQSAVFIGGMTSLAGAVSGQVMIFDGTTMTEAPNLTGDEAFLPRAFHRTAQLLDDTVIIVGGADGTQGLFDGIETFTPQFLSR